MTTIPNPGVYADQGALAEKAYNQALASIQQRKTGLFNQYGLTKQGGIDTYNQYGAVQQMNQQHGQQLQGADYGAQERGLGETGLGAQQETDLRYQHGADTTALGQGFNQGLGDLATEKTQALDTFNQGLNTAKQNAIMFAIASGDFNVPPAVRLARSMAKGKKGK